MKFEQKGVFESYLIDHVRQKAFHFITIHRLFTSQTDGCPEFSDGDAGPSHRWCVGVLRFLKAACNKDLPQQVSEGNVAAALEG